METARLILEGFLATAIVFGISKSDWFQAIGF